MQPFCPNEISPMGNSGCLPRGKPAATESRYPTYGACWVFECFRNAPNSDMDYGIFNAHTDVNACDCTRGCADTVSESALKVDSGRKIPCRTGESNLRLRHAGPMLNKLSCIPTHSSVLIAVEHMMLYAAEHTFLIKTNKETNKKTAPRPTAVCD